MRTISIAAAPILALALLAGCGQDEEKGGKAKARIEKAEARAEKAEARAEKAEKRVEELEKKLAAERRADKKDAAKAKTK